MLLQRHSQEIRPLTTAHLAQTMTLLSLTVGELKQKIESELASNPALELVEEHRCPTCRKHITGKGPCYSCSHPPVTSPDDPIVFVSPREDFHSFTGSGSFEDIPDDNMGPVVEELPQFVLRQIAPDLDERDRTIAAHILTNLDEDGLLAIPLLEIARYHHIPLSRIEGVLRLIQHAEPVGVGSPSPQAALMVQLEVLRETRSVPALAEVAVERGMSLLSRHRYIELGHLLGISTSQAKEIARYISENLNPFPGRAHWGDIRQTAEQSTDVYRQPDVIISRVNEKEDTPLMVEIAMPIFGTLRVNPDFREALMQAPVDKADQWRADLEHAALLVKCLQQRNHTIVRLMQRIAVLQRGFILFGDASIKPITRASLSKELEVHESTISRAVSSKSVQLPNGRIVPLAIFFDRSLHIRTALKEIVEQENKPLSDTEIGELLAQQGYPVARRTVAKYRAMEGILPAHLRTR